MKAFTEVQEAVLWASRNNLMDAVYSLIDGEVTPLKFLAAANNLRGIGE